MGKPLISEMETITSMVQAPNQLVDCLRTFEEREQKQIFAALKEVIIDDLAIITHFYEITKLKEGRTKT